MAIHDCRILHRRSTRGENMNKNMIEKLKTILQTRTKQQTLFAYTLGWIIIAGTEAWLLLSGQIIPGIILCGGILFLIVGLSDIIRAYQHGYQQAVAMLRERDGE